MYYLARWALGGGGVHEDTTILDGAVDISHHGANIAGTHRGLPFFRELALPDVLSDRLIPVLRIALVDREDIPSLWDLHVGICQDKLTNTLEWNEVKVVSEVIRKSSRLAQITHAITAMEHYRVKGEAVHTAAS